MKNASEWFRWLTPILLGILTAMNTRINSRLDRIEVGLVTAGKESRQYTDEVAKAISAEVRAQSDKLADVRVILAGVEASMRRWRGERGTPPPPPGH